MITIAGGIVLGFFALWAIDLLLLSFLTPGGQTFWLIAIGGLVGLALLASLPGWFIATVAIGSLAFAMMRKHAPNWTPWRDSKGESRSAGDRAHGLAPADRTLPASTCGPSKPTGKADAYDLGCNNARTALAKARFVEPLERNPLTLDRIRRRRSSLRIRLARRLAAIGRF